MRFKGLLAVVVMITAGLSQSALAASDPSVWAGGAVGLSVPNLANTSARPMYGITAGAKLGSEYGIGAYYLTSSKDESANNTTANFKYDFYGVELGYHFEGEAKGAYFGGRLGMSQVTNKMSGFDVSTSPMHWGLMVGYNYMIVDHVSLGGEVNFMSVSSSSTTVAGQTRDTAGFQTLNYLLTAKAWF